jgi:hypothetical protein
MTHQEEIPVWSYINFQLLYQIHQAQQKNMLSTMTISELIENTSKHMGSNIPLLDFYTPINTGSIFSFLYSLLVVPKELFKDEDQSFFADFDFTMTNYFEIELGQTYLEPKWKLFRILRNSISHVNFLVDQNNKFSIVLWNVNHSGVTDVKLKSDINKLSNFAVEIFKYYNLRVK